MNVKLSAPRKAALYKKLRKTVPAVDAELQDALAKQGDKWVMKAQNLAPHKTYDLIRSIHWSWRPPEGGGFLGVFKKKDPGSPAIYLIAGGGDEYYARFVEFGTKGGTKGDRVASSTGGRRSRKVKRTHPGTRPQPFFFPAYRLLRRGIRSSLSRSIGRAIKKQGFRG